MLGSVDEELIDRKVDDAIVEEATSGEIAFFVESMMADCVEFIAGRVYIALGTGSDIV